MSHAWIWYALATLGPAALIAAGAVFGGVLSGAGLFALTVVIFVLDRRKITPAKPVDADWLGLSIVLAGGHLALLAMLVLFTPDLSLAEAFLVLTGAGLWIGQVSNSNAHELIHNRRRWVRWIGRMIYSSILYGHHSSAHLLVHHVYAATPHDPNSAILGESYWRFVPRAWLGAYQAGRREEDRRRVGQARWKHPYIQNGALSFATLLIVALVGGWLGLLAYAYVAIYAQLQLLLSDYVQHYGLQRAPRNTGGYYPMAVQHSWNAPHAASSAMMLNAPRHSDHHTNPRKAFPALELDDAMPTLPHALPVMATLALVPPIWFRLMDGRARKWSDASAMTLEQAGT